MPEMTTCVCGQNVEVPLEMPTFPVNCPVCGRIVVKPVVAKKEVPEPREEISDSAFVATQDSANLATEPPMLLRMLLDPATIQRLLMFGGGLSVLGLIAWLISLGVFDDPRILAVALGAGTLTLLASGWGVVLRTRFRLAGQALTFLACVVAPLNLWFYNVQGLLTVDGHLWVGGLVCSLLYMMTVWKLRDPLFLYAVEAGITLTVLLLLGDLHHWDDSSAICLAMVALAAISIHAESAFDPDHPIFNRRKFGLPLFFSGQAQLAIGMVGTLSLQVLDWTLKPAAGDWCYSHLANTPALAGGLWLAAAYLWLYSDVAVRRLSVYTYLAALSLVLAEVTLLYTYLPLEVLVIALSATAIAVQVLNSRISEPGSRWSSITSSVGVIVGAGAFLLGGIRHFQHVGLIGTENLPNPLLFTIAMLSVWVNLACQGYFQRNRNTSLLLGCWIGAGLSLWLGGMHGLQMAGVQTFALQTPLLMIIPVALVLLASSVERLGGGKPPLLADFAVISAHGMAILGLIVSAGSVESVSEWTQFLLSAARNRSTLYSGVLFAELSVLYFATRTTATPRWTTLTCGGIFALAAGWKLLAFINLPEVWYSPLLAVFGIVLMIVGRMKLTTMLDQDQAKARSKGVDNLTSWQAAGDLSLMLGEMIAFLQTMPWLFSPLTSISMESRLPVMVTAALSAVGAVIAATRSLRGWHRFTATMIVSVWSLAWVRSLSLKDYQKIELMLELAGVATLIAGFSGRLKESERQKNSAVSLALWVGSALATLPVLCCTLMHRWSTSGPSLGDELCLITVTALMVAIGCVLQVRATTTIGAATLGLYLAILFGHLAYHPQVAIGVYLAAGGALIFMTGVVLSIYRDRLLALPARIAQREGIFRVIDWR